MQLIAKANTRQVGKQRPNWHSMLMPWIWIAPAIVMVTIFLLYPMLNTIWLSFFNADSSRFVGLNNYWYIFTSPNMLTILKNNLLWLVLGTTATITLGLIIAVLVDRVRFESQIKAAIFVPMAISLVGAGVIWRFIYQYSAPNQPQIGLLNAIMTSLGGQPQAWLITPGWNNIALIVAYVWMWTGFCMVILSAALKSIPSDILEAARTDGANSLTIFLHITVPMISPTIAVVATTMIINILKIFDIIYVMTGGNYHTSVVAVEYYLQIFTFNRFGVGSALTALLLLAVIPVMIINIQRFRIQKGQ